MKITKSEKQEKWSSIPSAIIVRPLRFIADRTITFDSEGKKVISEEYKAAKIAASKGDGFTVQKIARSVANG